MCVSSLPVSWMWSSSAFADIRISGAHGIETSINDAVRKRVLDLERPALSPQDYCQDRQEALSRNARDGKLKCEKRLFDQAKVATRSLEAKNGSAVLSKSIIRNGEIRVGPVAWLGELGIRMPLDQR